MRKYKVWAVCVAVWQDEGYITGCRKSLCNNYIPHLARPLQRLPTTCNTSLILPQSIALMFLYIVFCCNVPLSLYTFWGKWRSVWRKATILFCLPSLVPAVLMSLDGLDGGSGGRGRGRPGEGWEGGGVRKDKKEWLRYYRSDMKVLVPWHPYFITVFPWSISRPKRPHH